MKQCEPVELSDNNDTLTVELTIPHGIHLNSEAPSRYQILSGKYLARADGACCWNMMLLNVAHVSTSNAVHLSIKYQ